MSAFQPPGTGVSILWYYYLFTLLSFLCCGNATSLVETLLGIKKMVLKK